MMKSPSRICSSIIESPRTRNANVCPRPIISGGTAIVSSLRIASIGRPQPRFPVAVSHWLSPEQSVQQALSRGSREETLRIRPSVSRADSNW
jgi:hypothetical protein